MKLHAETSCLGETFMGVTGQVWLLGIIFVLALALGLIACTEVDNRVTLSTDRQMLFKVTYSAGTPTAFELVGIYDEDVLHSVGRLHGEGELSVALEDSQRRLLFAGSGLDPRRVFYDEFQGTTISGGSLTLQEAVGFVAVPLTSSSTGTVELVLDSPLGTGQPGAYTFNTETGETHPAVFHLEDGDLAFLAGNPNPAHAYIVVIVANGFGDDLGPFDTQAQGISEGLLEQDWYRDHEDFLSLWSFYDVEANDETSILCGGNTMAELVEVAERVNELWGNVHPKTVDINYGTARASSDLMVLITNQECRAFSIGHAVLLGTTDTNPTHLAHEIGHSLGNLDDEYAEEGRACSGRINTTPLDDIRWACLLQPNPTAETCSGGSDVGAIPPVMSCDDWGRPCENCMMRHADADFCPVCSNRMDLVFQVRSNGLLYSDMTETCNGVDDNGNGSVDEGCGCEGSTCSPVPEVCGDGLDNDCDGDIDEGCGGCGNGVCEEPGETCRSCPVDCGECPATCPNGSCDADETCVTCPEDCGACPADCAWYMCSNSCWPTGTSDALACALPPSPVDCSVYGTMAECDAHSADCAWYLCSSSCWPRGTLDVAACNTCASYISLEQCNAQAPDCAWYACSSSCWPTGTANGTACPDCTTLTTRQVCDSQGAACAWYYCSDTCWPEGTPNDTACPDCSLFGTVEDCNAHAPVCAWYACTGTCWRRGTSNDMACNACADRRTEAECDG
jgi:hypothetical protein